MSSSGWKTQDLNFFLGEMALKISDLIRRNAKLRPDETGLVSDGKTYTFTQLEEMANKLVNGLLDLGVKMGDHVALLLENGPECFISFFAIPKIGVVVVPLNTKLAEPELAHCIRDCSPRVLIYSEKDFPHELIHLLKEKFHGTRFLNIRGFYDLIKIGSPQDPRKRLPKRVNKNEVAVIIYTGGTTGLPKGVLLSHNNIISTISSFAVSAMKSQHDSGGGVLKSMDPQAEQRMLTTLPMFHAACTTGLITALLAGTRIYLERKFNAPDFLRIIEEEKISTILVVPTIIGMLLQENLANYDLSSLHMIVYGASAISDVVLERALNAFPDIDFVQLFGQTEAAPVITFFSIDDHRKARTDKKLLKSAGKPIMGTEVKIFDAIDQEVSIGEIGEVVARGEGVMKGYLNKPDKTAMTLRGGWLHTGDLGKIDEEGYLFIVGRAKDMIVSGGENIYPKEVESVLHKHPAVLECSVIGIPDETYQEAVCACIVLNKGYELGKNVSEEKIIEYAKERLARYKAPKKVIFMEDLPKSPQGKVLKRTLRYPHWKGKERQVV